MGSFDWRFERVVVDYRKEDILHFTKELKSHEFIRRFSKANSVFADWVEDNPSMLKKCMEHDFNVWNIKTKMKKIGIDSNDYEELV
jgi:hypothetical protein